MIGVLESDETIGVLNFKVNLPGLVRVSETIPQNEKSSNRRLIESKKMGLVLIISLNLSVTFPRKN